MEKKFSFMMGFLIFTIVFGGIFVFCNYYSERDSVLENVSSKLENINKEKFEEINSYFFKIEDDAKDLQQSEDIKNLLKQNLVFDEEVIVMNVNERARIISKEVENYLLTHPEMTLDDLQKSSEFQKIAIQPVGNEGYSTITDYENQVIVKHKFPEFVGRSFEESEKDFSEIYEIQIRSKEESNVSGFYNWEELDGDIRRKYVRVLHINPKTADGVGLSIGATAYVDDYKIIKKYSEYLDSFTKKNNYHNVLLISDEGYISYESNNKYNLGTNLNWEVNSDNGLAKNYFGIRDNGNSFYGPYVERYGEVYPKFSFMAPVYEDKEFLGYVVLISEMDKVFETIELSSSAAQTEESYLIRDDRLLISPLKLADFDILVQNINTENANSCFVQNVNVKDWNVGEFLDYRGTIVLGTHSYFPKIDWCILTEVDKKEVVDRKLKNLISDSLYLYFFGIFVLTLLGFVVGFYFDERNKNLKKRKNKLSIFFKNLKLRYYGLFAIMFAIGYFFIITSFFQGWQNAKFFDDVPDLFIFIVGFLIFSYGLKIKKIGARNFIIWGGALIVFRRLLDIPFQEYQVIIGHVLTPFLWVPVLIAEMTGFLLLLIGLGRLKYD